MCSKAAEAVIASADRGANLDVIFPWHVSVWMRASTVDGHSLPLSGRGRIVVPTGPLAVLHLDLVKRWGCDGSGFEPHRTGVGVVRVAQVVSATIRSLKYDERAE